MSKPNHRSDYSMLFEITMMQLFGKKAHHIAGYYHNKKLVKQWMKKAIRKMIKEAAEIDTTTRHKEIILSELRQLNKTITKEKDLYKIILDFILLCSRFLGFDYCSGSKLYTPFYHQTKGQYYTKIILGGGDVMRDCIDQKNIVNIRRELVKQLKEQKKLSDYEISTIFNISEYELKKLKKEL